MKLCTFPDCTRRHAARGLCRSHYGQKQRGVELTPIGSSYAGVLKSATPHGTINGYTNHSCRCDLCKSAWSDYNSARTRARIAQDLPPERNHGEYSSYKWGCRCSECKTAQRNRRRENKYLVSVTDLEALAAKQGGRCACCAEAKPLVVDHIHGTHHVRGLLCHKCNSGIGKLGDDIAGLQRALAYLIRSTP